MTDKQIIIDGVDVSECKYFQSSCVPDYSGGYLYKNVCRNHGFYDCDKKPCAFKCIEYQKQLKRKEQECEKLHERIASIIYNLTGGRLSYSTYTLEACEQAYRDQLDIDVEKATRELQVDVSKYKQALDEIRQYRVCEINDVDGEEDDVILGIIDEVMEL